MNRIALYRRQARLRLRREEGSVLIPVLAVIVSCSLIVSALMALSQLGTSGMAAHTRLQKSAYLCEGALNRVQWLVAADRATSPGTSLLYFDYADFEYERFPADGAEHVMDYHGIPVKFIITDAAAGLDFSRLYRRTTVQRLAADPSADSTYLDQVEQFSELLSDYVDSDDTIAEDGMESADYEDSGRRPLPRNGELQYREELFWIPGFTDLFPPDRGGRLSSVRVIPPNSMISTGSSGQGQGGGGASSSNSLFAQNPNLFGAGDFYLRYVCKLEEDELAQVREAILLYQTERVPLQDSIEGTLFTKLLNNLNWSQGQTVTVVVDPAAAGSGPSKRLAATWTVSDSAAGPTDGVVRYLEWMFF